MKALPLPPITPLIAARFWSLVDVGTEKACWPWKGFVDPTGYGRFHAIPSRVIYAHRVAYQLLRGPAPALGLELDHLCRVRHCVNPAHLEVVTLKVNTQRGVSVTARNTAKTHCPQGHPLSGDNLKLKHRKNGTVARVCLTCRRVHQRALNYKYRAPGYQPRQRA